MQKNVFLYIGHYSNSIFKQLENRLFTDISKYKVL